MIVCAGQQAVRPTLFSLRLLISSLSFCLSASKDGSQSDTRCCENGDDDDAPHASGMALHCSCKPSKRPSASSSSFQLSLESVSGAHYSSCALPMLVVGRPIWPTQPPCVSPHPTGSNQRKDSAARLLSRH